MFLDLLQYCCCQRQNPIVSPGPVNVRVKINWRLRENNDVYLRYFKTHQLEIRHECISDITFLKNTCILQVL